MGLSVAQTSTQPQCEEEGECCFCNICRSGELLVIHHSGSLHSYYIDRDAGFQPRHHFFFTEEYPLGVAAAAYNAKHKVCIFVCVSVWCLTANQHAYKHKVCICVCVSVWCLTANLHAYVFVSMSVSMCLCKLDAHEFSWTYFHTLLCLMLTRCYCPGFTLHSLAVVVFRSLGPRPAAALLLWNPMWREVTMSNDPRIQL